MFTGLVQYLGKINSITNEPPGIRLAVHAGPLAQSAQIGDSICTNGCCLSVVQTDRETLEFQLGPETLNPFLLHWVADMFDTNLLPSRLRLH